MLVHRKDSRRLCQALATMEKNILPQTNRTIRRSLTAFQSGQTPRRNLFVNFVLFVLNIPEVAKNQLPSLAGTAESPQAIPSLGQMLGRPAASSSSPTLERST